MAIKPLVGVAGERAGASVPDQALLASLPEPVPVSASGDDPSRGDVILTRDVFDFLMGTAAYDGVWFGDYQEGLPGAFWWRAVLAAAERGSQRQAFQARVQPWLLTCFGAEIAADYVERNHRFLEEALELVQSLGCTASEAHQLVDYTYGRAKGEASQEVGGVMVTLAALCLANHLDMHEAGETELSRIWTKVDAIRAKQAAKPKHSPLPASVDTHPEGGDATAAPFMSGAVPQADALNPPVSP